MLLVAAIPVLAVGALTVGSLFALADSSDERLAASESELTDTAIGASRADRARLVAERIDAFVGERVADVAEWATADAIIETTEQPYEQVGEVANLAPATIDAQLGADFELDGSGRTSRWLRARTGPDGPFLDAVVTEANGFTVGSAEAATDFTNADSEWWAAAWADGAYVGPVMPTPGGEPAFDIAIRIDHPSTGAQLGVIRAEVAVASLWPLTDTYATPDESIDVRLLTEDGLVLAETATGHDPVAILGPATAGSDGGTAFRAIGAAETPTGHVIAGDTLVGYSRSTATRALGPLDAEIDVPTWLIAVEQPAAIALAPLDGLGSLATDLSTTARVLTVTIAALMLAALAMAFLLARLLARRIAEPINALRDEADRLADHELPELIAVLRSPDAPSRIPEVTPVEIDADGEVAELASAFNSVRTTAVQLAASEAIERNRDVTSLLVNLGRRNQHLVGRQLRFIEELEHAESDPDALRNLFVLDQMATRMRRNAESLLVLAGEDSPRRIANPRPVIEVIRAATGEVEDYARIALGAIDLVLIQPHAVHDVTHLLAELIENATNFSPPEHLVHVVGARTNGNRYTISIIDHGVGMSRDAMREANLRITHSDDPDDSTSSFLGLRVVGRLAARYNIDARLVESPTDGVTAKVTLPASLLATVPEPIAQPAGARAASRASATAATPPSIETPASNPSRLGPTPPAIVGVGASDDVAVEPDSLAEPPATEDLEPVETPPIDDVLGPEPDPSDDRSTVIDLTDHETDDLADDDPEAIDLTDHETDDLADEDPEAIDLTDHETEPEPETGHDLAVETEPVGDPAINGGPAGAPQRDLALALFDEAIEASGVDDVAGGTAWIDVDGRPPGESTDEETAEPAVAADTSIDGAGNEETGLRPGPPSDATLTSSTESDRVPDAAPPTVAASTTPTVASSSSAPVAAAAGRPVLIEDERVGAPIPPFRARESKRPDAATASAPGEPMAVRARVRSSRPHDGGGRNLVADAGPEVRAAEVRDKLNRFASGVRAARRPARTPTPTDPDVTPPAPPADSTDTAATNPTTDPNATPAAPTTDSTDPDPPTDAGPESATSTDPDPPTDAGPESATSTDLDADAEASTPANVEPAGAEADTPSGTTDAEPAEGGDGGIAVDGNARDGDAKPGEGSDDDGPTSTAHDDHDDDHRGDATDPDEPGRRSGLLGRLLGRPAGDRP